MKTWIKLLPLLLLLWSAKAMAGGCHNVGVNLLNGGAAITVDNTAGGVAVVSQTLNRCSLLLCNSQAYGSGNDMRCCQVTGYYTCTPTSSVGTLIPAGTCKSYGPEGVQGWNCIRTGASNASADINEALLP